MPFFSRGFTRPINILPKFKLAVFSLPLTFIVETERCKINMFLLKQFPYTFRPRENPRFIIPAVNENFNVFLAHQNYCYYRNCIEIFHFDFRMTRCIFGGEIRIVFFFLPYQHHHRSKPLMLYQSLINNIML